MDTKKLEQIIENHRHWFNEDVEGWETMRANLCGANLSGVDLSDVDLYGANLRNANLCDANMRGAILRYADLRGANLCDARLRGVDLCDANLRGANLCDADMRGVDLCCANLRGANLCGADLRFTNLSEADLSGADLRGANLRCADLSYANLLEAKNVPYIPMICPEEGSFIGYKKASGKIVKLLISEDAKRSSAATRKCRCDRATVLAIYELDGSVSKVTEVSSNRDCNFIYKINKEVVVDDFDNNRWNECSTGIHFFMQRREAMRYMS